MSQIFALERTSQFKRDYRRELLSAHDDLEAILSSVLEQLIGGQPLPASLRDHPLKGRWKNFRDCHLKPDLVLIYQRTEGAVRLVRLGSHSELFG